jgi:hypothetical protein
MITTYQALTMGQYQEIDRITRTGGDELEVQVAILSILTGKPEAELLRLPLPEYTALAGASPFLRSPIAEVPKVRKEYALGEWRLRPCQDYRKLTAGQYIDFQAFTKDTLDFCGLLSVLMVPEGRTYAEGYDPLEVRAAIADRLPMPDGMALIAFFFEAVRRINSGFPNLLRKRPAPGKGQGEAGADAGTNQPGPDTFENRWGWIENVCQAAEVQGLSWDELLVKPALEFLNTMAFLRDRREWQKAELEKWKKTH